MRLTTTLLGMLFLTSAFSQKSDEELLIEAYNENNPIKSLELTKQISNPEAFGDSLQSLYALTLGIANGKLGKEDSSIFFLEESLKISHEGNINYLKARAGNAKGLVLNHSGKYDEAIVAYQEALAIAEQYNFIIEEATILGNMGGVYFHISDYESAIKYSQRSLDLAYESENTEDLAYGHLRLAVTYEEIDSLKTSIYHNTKASSFAESLEDYVLLTYVEKTLGNIHKKLNRMDSSLYHHKRARKFAKLEGEQENIASTTMEISRVYLETGNIDKAEEEAMSVLKVSETKGYPHQAKLAYDVLYEIAIKKNDFRRALSNRNNYILINDSLNAVETKERIAELEIQYETAKKEKEIVEANTQIEQEQQFQQFLYIIIGIVTIFSFVSMLLLLQRFKLRRALLSQEVETLKVQINSIFGGGMNSLELTQGQINEKLDKPLTDREYEILNEALSDKSNAEIASQTGISVSTIKFHLKNVYQKLGVSGRKEALEFMIKQKK